MGGCHRGARDRLGNPPPERGQQPPGSSLLGRVPCRYLSASTLLLGPQSDKYFFKKIILKIFFSFYCCDGKLRKIPLF